MTKTMSALRVVVISLILPLALAGCDLLGGGSAAPAASGTASESTPITASGQAGGGTQSGPSGGAEGGATQAGVGLGGVTGLGAGPAAGGGVANTGSAGANGGGAGGSGDSGNSPVSGTGGAP